MYDCMRVFISCCRYYSVRVSGFDSKIPDEDEKSSFFLKKKLRSALFNLDSKAVTATKSCFANKNFSLDFPLRKRLKKYKIRTIFFQFHNLRIFHFIGFTIITLMYIKKNKKIDIRKHFL